MADVPADPTPRDTPLTVLAASPDVALHLLPVAAVISIRARGSARAQAANALGLDDLPSPNTVTPTRLGNCLWIRPDEWHVVGPYSTRGTISAALDRSIPPDAGMVIDLSASRTMMELVGERSRDVLASCCPLDVHPRGFAVGTCAQSLIGRAPMLLHLVDEAPRWRIMVRPSLAAHVQAWLRDAIEAG